MKKTNNIKRAILPILASAGMILPNTSIADKISLSNASNIGPSNMVIQHQSGGFEGVGDDGYWAGSIPNPTQPEMKIITNPY